MKFIDVTLRDGGHQHGFNWPLEFVQRYMVSISSFPEIEFIELGYWKQSGKFDGPFYSIEEELLSSICKMTSSGSDNNLKQFATCALLFPINFDTFSWS